MAKLCMSSVIFLIVELSVLSEAAYYGVLLGDLQEFAHDVTGRVYVQDQAGTILFIKNFNYDGLGPDAFFWAGEKSKGVADGADSKGTIIPDENGSTDVLGAYTNKDITLRLPNGLKVTDLKWLSVWCRQFTANFAEIRFGSSITLPGPQMIGKFSHRAHQFYTDDVTLLDSRTIHMKNVRYDGLGPDAFWLVGTGSNYKAGTKVPDETGSIEKAHGYNGQDITLTLPGALTFADVDWFVMYCIAFSQLFGDIAIPSTLTVPVTLNTPPVDYPGTSDTELDNCESVDDNLNVAWGVNTTHITVELTGVLDGDNGYMAFGVSGSDTGTSMIGADVTVGYIDGTTPRVQDYYLSAYAQCSTGNGVCPDTDSGGSNDVTLVNGKRVNGVTKITYTRLLNTGDSSKDKVIQTGSPVYIVWAIGGINTEGYVTKHSKKESSGKQLTFGRTPALNCKDLSKETETVVPWAATKICGEDLVNNVLVAEIGSAGGQSGYKAITGQESWGIAWYINSLLIPEITLKRNVTYTFKINGGNDPANPAKYHPFYITDSVAGGYVQVSQADRQNEKIFAGVENGNPTSNAVGSYCEWLPKTTDQSASVNSFDEYAKTLEKTCTPASNIQTGELKWTPNKDTPDLVYYQCFTHRFLGWKIHIVDEYTCGGAASLCLQLASLILPLMASLVYLHAL